MKALRTLVAALAVTLAASPLQAQETTKVTLTSAGSITHAGVHVGPYQARLGSDPTTPSVDVYCVDYLHTVTTGQSWNATVTNLMSGSLAATRGGDAALEKYQQMAWLTTKFEGATAAETRAIHTAIWNVMTPGSPSLISGPFGTNYWLDLAAQRYDKDGLDYSTFAVVTDVRFQNGGTQEFLMRVPSTVTPEPGTYLLMATGLVGVGLVARRRRQQG